MSSSEAEVDISVVSSPEPSPLGAAARDSPLLARLRWSVFAWGR